METALIEGRNKIPLWSELKGIFSFDIVLRAKYVNSDILKDLIVFAM